jgi:UDP-N-acetylglucosamine 2-epimerase (non-hydrolysing)/GDP/UDP-N,N'-diacetylbacillosamine 2-epimerase (hydrolysing)
MLAGAIAAAHMNLPIVHMSGGDRTGSIDHSIRNAITKFAHIHLPTSSDSVKQLRLMGESPNRILQVGEPALDVIRQARFVDSKELAKEFSLDLRAPLALLAQHSVTTESDEAESQILATLRALQRVGIQTIVTYPNPDAGGKHIIQAIESFKGQPFLRVVQSIGHLKFLSLMRIASFIVGNSSSGIIEAPSFKLPAINIGERQYGRLRACNVIDVGYRQRDIENAFRYVLTDADFRRRLKSCRNPYGDGRASERTVRLLARLRIGPRLIAKWIQDDHETFF